MFLLIITIILFLYLRTYKYNYLIDDHNERWTMYHPKYIPPPPVPVEDGVRYDSKRRSLLCTFTNISVYILTCLMVNFLWGWKVALLYTVMPLNVSGVSWKTGNYYMTTSFLVLVAYYFLSSYSMGIVLAIVLYWSALHSTISALPLLAVALLYPYGYLLAIPLTIFLTGQRYREGIRKRKEAHKEIGITVGDITWRNPIIAIEVTVYYILLSTGLMPMGFFHTFGREGNVGKVNGLFIGSLALFVLFCVWAYTYSPFGLFWFLMFIGPFSQLLKSPGQFISERYTYISSIGFCMILSNALNAPVYYFLLGVWVMIALRYIGAYKSNEALFSHSIVSFPDCEDNYVNISSFYMDRNQYVKAIAPIECALRLTKGRKTKLWGNLAKCCAVMGHYHKAYESLKNAMLDAYPNQVKDIMKMKDDMERQMKKIDDNRAKLKKMGVI